MKKFTLPELDWTKYPKVTIGNRKRYSTATAVSYVNENLILAASFFGKKIYLIDLVGDKIIDEIDTKGNPDLMDYKNGIIVTSDYPYATPNGTASIFKLDNNKITYKETVALPPKTKAHGVGIIDDDNIVITSNSDHNRGCLFINRKTKEIKNFTNFELYPKDIYFTDDRFLIVTSESLPNIGDEVIVKESILYLFDKNSKEKLDELKFIGQTDSLVLNGEDGFITIQSDDALLHFKLKNDKLSFVKMIGGFDFPHGISQYNQKIAVSNYGENSIRIFDLSELIY